MNILSPSSKQKGLLRTFFLEVGGSISLQNVGNYLPDYMMSLPRRQQHRVKRNLLTSFPYHDSLIRSEFKLLYS
jgi:hypothetical protein